VLGVDCDVLNVTHPESDEGEEGSSSLPHAFFPAIVPEHLHQLPLCFAVLLLLLDYTVKVILPVEHQAEGSLPLRLRLVYLLAQTELSSTPLLDLGVVCARDGSQHFISELRDAEVGVGTE
jgi:hypothetical protein